MAKSKEPKDGGDPYARMNSLVGTPTVDTTPVFTGTMTVDPPVEPPHPEIEENAPVGIEGQVEATPVRNRPAYLIGDRPPLKAGVDPLIVEVLTMMERLVSGGLINPWASSVTMECRQLILKLREQVCENA